LADITRKSGKSRETSFEPVRRLLFLYNLFRRTSPGRKLTAQRATEQMNASGYDVSLRTVQRYLEQCEQHFGGIRRDEGKPAGWWLETSSQDDSLHISKEAALALCLAEAHLKHLIPSAELKHLAPLFSHARKTVEFGGDVNRYKKMLDRIWIFPRGFQLRPPACDSKVFDRVMAAILESREIAISYRKPSESSSKSRVIEPLGIVERSGVYYLVGRERLSDKPKNWALHRIESLNELGYFSYPRSFKISDYARAGSLNMQFSPAVIQIHIRFSASAGAHLLESKLSEDQETKILPDGRVEIRASVSNCVEFRWWLMGLAPECEVLEPTQLREEIYEKLVVATKNFGPTRGKRAS
jgi:predicted DNA-binding transcriptional regulator YafY